MALVASLTGIQKWRRFASLQFGVAHKQVHGDAQLFVRNDLLSIIEKCRANLPLSSRKSKSKRCSPSWASVRSYPIYALHKSLDGRIPGAHVGSAGLQHTGLIHQLR